MPVPACQVRMVLRLTLVAPAAGRLLVAQVGTPLSMFRRTLSRPMSEVEVLVTFVRKRTIVVAEVEVMLTFWACQP